MAKIITCIIAVILILVLILSACWWNKKFPIPNHEDIIFIMRPPNKYWFISVSGFIFCAIFIILSLFLGDEWIYAFLPFYFCMLASIYLSICILFEKYVVKRDSLVFYTPLLPVKEIKFYEITSVKLIENGIGNKLLEGYNKRKKIFSIEESMSGFDLLCDYFDKSRKIEHTPVVENFSITAEKSEIIMTIIMCFILSSYSVVIISGRDEPELFYQIAVPFFALLLLLRTIHVLLWRITIDFHSISIRNSFGIVKSYEIRQITKVVEREEYIILYIGENKTAKISKGGKNFPYFMERLQRSGIAVHKSH
jgi:hypothetical protein